MSAGRTIQASFRGMVGAFALDARFETPAQGVTALFGPSGCGKTTVLRCVAGLLRLDDGYCQIGGEVWQDRDGRFLPTWRRPLGYVFQEASLFPHLSVRKNLMFGASRAPGAAEAAVAFDEVVDLLGVEKLLDRSPGRLSGGERQRVAIGRALLTQPMLLLMDEPLAALDRAAKGDILPFLERLRDRLALPILYVTHDMAEVERLADHIALMEAGRVVATGPLAEIEADPALPLAIARDAAVTLDAVAETYDEAYGLLTLAVAGGRFAAPSGPVRPGERRRMKVLAGDVSLAREPPGATSILNVLPGRIVASRRIGTNEIVAVVGLGEGQGARLLSRLTRRSWDQLGLADGTRVTAQVKAVALAPGRDFPPPVG